MTRLNGDICLVKERKGALVIRLPSVYSIVSWAPYNPGARKSDVIAILEAPCGKNAAASHVISMEKMLRSRRIPANAIALLTAAKVKDFSIRRRRSGNLIVEAIATVGITNARSVMDEPDESNAPGTINIVIATNAVPSLHGRLEAVGIVSSAKTAALRQSGVDSPVSDRWADATGTDCVVVASSGKIRDNRAGLHTRLGSMIGGAVFECVMEGIGRCRRN